MKKISVLNSDQDCCSKVLRRLSWIDSHPNFCSNDLNQFWSKFWSKINSRFWRDLVLRSDQSSDQDLELVLFKDPCSQFWSKFSSKVFEKVQFSTQFKSLIQIVVQSFDQSLELVVESVLIKNLIKSFELVSILNSVQIVVQSFEKVFWKDWVESILIKVGSQINWRFKNKVFLKFSFIRNWSKFWSRSWIELLSKLLLKWLELVSVLNCCQNPIKNKFKILNWLLNQFWSKGSSKNLIKFLNWFWSKL